MDRRMKILCFHPALAPYRVDFFNLLADQSDLKLVLLQRNLLNQKFDQEKLIAQLQVEPEYAKGICIRRRVFPLDVLSRIRACGPDVILAYEASPVTVLLCLLKICGALRGAKLWTSMDDAPNMIAERVGIRRIVRDFVLRHVGGVVVPSEAAAREYKRIVPAVVCSVVPIIHDEKVIRVHADRVYADAEVWRERNLRPGEKALFFIGRLAPVKNLEWLVAQTERPDWPKGVKLFLVGDGECRRMLECRAHCLGRFEGDSLQKIFAAADALVLCSHSEPYGAVVAEALQWGTPCVVRDRCGCSELIDSNNGCVFTIDCETDGLPDFFSALYKALQLGKSVKSLLRVELSNAVANFTQGVST